MTKFTIQRVDLKHYGTRGRVGFELYCVLWKRLVRPVHEDIYEITRGVRGWNSFRGNWDGARLRRST